MTESIDLETSNGATTAFVALPEGGGAEAPAVLLIQEWWGINDHIRDIAGRYASEGYVCAAPDLYRGKLAKDSKEAGEMMQALSIEDGIETIRAAMNSLKERFGASKIGITGYCMGGTFAFRAACDIEGLSGAAPFYGDIPDTETLSKLTIPVLFIAGERDKWINPAKVESLKEAARAYDLPVEAVTYDADHAFFNDTRPEVYDAEAAADAWKRVLGFFGKLLRGHAG